MRRVIAFSVLLVASLISGPADFATAAVVLKVAPTEFWFTANEGGANPADQILSIWKGGGGGGTLNWEVTEDCNWIVVEPNSGESTGEVDDVNVIVDISGLRGGSYNCELTVTGEGANQSPQTVDVNLVITGIIIELSAGEFEFLAVEGGTNPEDQILGISNSGVGTLNWEVTCDCNWLTADPNIGSSTGEIDDVNLAVDATGLPCGQYDCNLTVSDSNAGNSPQIVDVNLVVYRVRELHVPAEYPTIQVAINDCNIGDSVIVAPGMYTGTGNKDLDFGGKAITVRSELGPQLTIIDCENSGRGFYFHGGEDASSVVSGFNIKRGSVIGSDAKGGGIHCSGSSPTIEDCIITNNTAIGSSGIKNAYGGGIYCTSNSNPNIINCTISDNAAKGHSFTQYSEGGYAYGGGIYCSSNSSPIIINCTINNNESKGGNGDVGGVMGWWGVNGYGGGIYCSSNSNPTIENSSIINNKASGGLGGTYLEGELPDLYEVGERGGDAYGGGIHGSNLTIKNCIVAVNKANGGDGGDSIDDMPGWGGDAYGGGIYCGTTSVNNCTIINNTAAYGISGYPGGRDGDSYGGGISGSGTTTISDCILWGNGDDLYGCSATYSCIEDGDANTGNISADPCFVTGPQGNYYLSQTAAWQDINSPCVDAGSDTAANLGMDIFTIRTDQMCDEGVVDMGYHYPMIEYADLDLDRDVDFVDFTIFAAQWKQPPGIPSADIMPPGGNGIIDENDLDLLVNLWLWGKLHLVAHWKFDEGAGTIAYDSAGDNNGILVGEPNWTSGQIGGALDFNGVDDYVLVPDSDSISVGNQDYTLSAWISPDTIGGVIASKLKDGDDKEYAVKIRGDGNLQLDVEKNANNQYAQTTTSPITTSSWQHVVVTFDSSTTTPVFYHNGEVEVSTSNISTLPDDLDDDLYIGMAGGTYQGGHFDGLIDDVRIYDRVLTDEEVLQLYQQGL